MPTLLIWLALLPALLLLPALGGFAVWRHAHGPSGTHAHWLASTEDVGDARAHHALHAHEPTRDETYGGGEGYESAPVGLVLAWPRFEAPLARVHVLPPALACAVGRAAFGYIAPPLAPFPDGVEGRAAGPPSRARRSGLAELLRGSHAILI